MRFSTALVAAVAFQTITAVSVKAYESQDEGGTCSAVRYPPPSVRPPPKDGYQGYDFAQWTPPPPENLYGTYHVTHASNVPTNTSFNNLRVERYPVLPTSEVFPAGSDAEIESWSTCFDPEAKSCRDPNAVSTLFGYNIPVGAQGPTDTKYTAAWKYTAAGALEDTVHNLRAILVWGEDDNGSDYFAQYTSGTHIDGNNTDGIIIASRNSEGLSPATYICISSSLKQLAEELEDDQLSELVSQLKPLEHDHRRDSEGPIDCEPSCTNNTAFETPEARQPERRGSTSTQLLLNNAATRKLIYPLGAHRGGYLPWWGWLTMGLLFGLPLVGGLCVAVPVALLRGRQRRRFARAQRAAQDPRQARGSSSVAEPQMVQTA